MDQERMKFISIVVGLCMLGSSPATSPLILTRSDIGESYYDGPPADLLGVTEWLGLYHTGSRWRLEASKVDFVPEPAGASTVYRLTTEPADAVLLFAGIEPLSVGHAETVNAWPVELSSQEREAVFLLGGDTYTVRTDSADPHLCDAVITLSAFGRSQSLYDPAESPFACDEPHFAVHWVGDLDRDGRLDLVVAFSSKYSYHPRQIFLSSVATAGKLVGQAGRYERFAR